MVGEFWLLLGLLIFLWLYLSFAAFRVLTYILLAFFLVAIFFKFFVKKYDEYERAIIFRLGKFNRIAGPGWSIVIPFFEKEFQKLDVRTHMISLEIPLAFTKDDLRLKVDGIAYYRIIDPSKAVLQIDDYQRALQNLLVSQVRNVIGSMHMRELFSNLDSLNDMVSDAVRRQTWRWGIDVPSIQIRSVSPPEEIAIAMQQKEIAAQQLQAQRFLAEAKRVMISAIGDAAKNLDDRAIMYFYIKALEELGRGQATKIIFPMQFLQVLEDIGKNANAMLAGAGIGMSADELVKLLKEKIAGK